MAATGGKYVMRVCSGCIFSLRASPGTILSSATFGAVPRPNMMIGLCRTRRARTPGGGRQSVLRLAAHGTSGPGLSLRFIVQLIQLKARVKLSARWPDPAFLAAVVLRAVQHRGQATRNQPHDDVAVLEGGFVAGVVLARQPVRQMRETVNVVQPDVACNKPRRGPRRADHQQVAVSAIPPVERMTRGDPRNA